MFLCVCHFPMKFLMKISWKWDSIEFIFLRKNARIQWEDVKSDFSFRGGVKIVLIYVRLCSLLCSNIYIFFCILVIFIIRNWLEIREWEKRVFLQANEGRMKEFEKLEWISQDGVNCLILSTDILLHILLYWSFNALQVTVYCFFLFSIQYENMILFLLDPY